MTISFFLENVYWGLDLMVSILETFYIILPLTLMFFDDKVVVLTLYFLGIVNKHHSSNKSKSITTI